MAMAVQSIVNGARDLGQGSGQIHNELGRPKAVSSPSIRGKKEIARSRASLNLDKELVGQPVGSESSLPIIASFLDNRGFNPTPPFNFKATSRGQSVGNDLDNGQRLEQTNMEVQTSTDLVVESNGELLGCKATSVVTNMLIEAQIRGGSEYNDRGLSESGILRVEVKERLGKGHGVAE